MHFYVHKNVENHIFIDVQSVYFYIFLDIQLPLPAYFISNIALKGQG